MTNPDMITAIQENNITDDLIDALADFYWDFDPYGIMDNYGHLEDDGVRDALKKDITYVLEHDPENLIADLRED